MLFEMIKERVKMYNFISKVPEQGQKCAILFWMCQGWSQVCKLVRTHHERIKSV